METTNQTNNVKFPSESDKYAAPKRSGLEMVSDTAERQAARRAALGLNS